MLTGYRSDHEYMLHYGKSMRLQPNAEYRVLIKFSSPYFASHPRFEVLTEAPYRGKVLGDNLMRLNHALKLAHTDSMTGIGNRHAFDQLFAQELKLSFMEDDDHQPMLILVDLDGLKLVNDKYGHARGDDLLRAFARALLDLNIDHVTSFRLGGDESAIFARKHHDAILHDKLAAIERSLSAMGFAESGVSFGIAFASEISTPAEMFNAADRRMYERKSFKRIGRHGVAPHS